MYYPPWLHQLIEWISHTWLSQTIQDAIWLIPAIQSVHYIFVSIVVGSYLMVNLRTLGVVATRISLAAMVDRFKIWIWVSLIGLLITGSLLAIAEPGRSLNNPTFQVKMFMLLGLSFITYIFQAPLKNDPAYWDANPTRRGIASLSAAVSISLLIVIMFAGRWIAYTVSPT